MIISQITEKDRIIQQTLYKHNVLLNLLNYLKENSLFSSELTKNLQSKILETLKRGGFSAGSIFYENLVFILALLPIKDDSFLINFCESTLLGILNDDIRFYAEYLVNSFYECSIFIAEKRAEKPEKFLKKIVEISIKFYLGIDLEGKIVPGKNIPISFSQMVKNLEKFENFFIDFFKNDLILYFSHENYSNFFNLFKYLNEINSNFDEILQGILVKVNESLIENLISCKDQKTFVRILVVFLDFFEKCFDDQKFSFDFEKIEKICVKAIEFYSSFKKIGEMENFAIKFSNFLEFINSKKNEEHLNRIVNIYGEFYKKSDNLLFLSFFLCPNLTPGFFSELGILNQNNLIHFLKKFMQKIKQYSPKNIKTFDFYQQNKNFQDIILMLLEKFILVKIFHFL